MATTTETAPVGDPSVLLGGPAVARRPAWGPAHFLALAAVPLLAYEAWTLAHWIAAGPHQVTAYRTTGSTSWYAGWALQGALAVGVALIAVGLVRTCRRERRLTFDALLFVGLLTTVFWDTTVNFVEPLWFYSSDWLNLNDWWGHAPLIVNPAAGHGAFPLPMLLLLYPFFVFDARLLGRVMQRAQRRWPGISRARLVAVAFVPATLTGAILSLAMILPHLWGGAGMPVSVLHGDFRWTLGEILYIGAWSTTLGSMRFFTDDRGRRVVERGLDHLPARRATPVRLLATIAFCNLSVILWSTPLILAGLKAQRYPDYPRHLSNLSCDTPGLTGSTYGLCPGSPGFRVPVR